MGSSPVLGLHLFLSVLALHQALLSIKLLARYASPLTLPSGPKMNTILSSGLTPSLGFVYFYQGSPLIPFSKNVRNSLLSLGAGSNPSPFSFWALKYTSHMPVTFQQKPFFLIPKPWAGSCLLPLCSHTAPLLTYLILSLTGPVEVLNPPRRFPTSASPGVFPSHGLACYSLPVFLAINCVTFFNFEYVRFVC